MGAEVVATCVGTPTNGGARVRAPACARQPRGTGLGVGSASPPLGAQCPRRLASDRRSLACIGVCAVVRVNAAWRDVARVHAFRLKTFQSDPF
jgi:hypothetical protein